MKNKEIAEKLIITEKTVKKHLSNIYQKLREKEYKIKSKKELNLFLKEKKVIRNKP